MKMLFPIVIILTAVSIGCTRNEENSADNFSNEVVVEAGSGKELCFESKKDDEVFFRFEADQSLQFNFHYHIDDEIFYPVEEHATAGEKGEYLVPKDETYCLMWENTHDVGVRLSVDVAGIGEVTWY